jgi:hypothetical protein
LKKGRSLPSISCRGDAGSQCGLVAIYVIYLVGGASQDHKNPKSEGRRQNRNKEEKREVKEEEAG